MGNVQETEANAGTGKARVGKSRGTMWVEEEFQGNGESGGGMGRVGESKNVGVNGESGERENVGRGGVSREWEGWGRNVKSWGE